MASLLFGFLVLIAGCSSHEAEPQLLSPSGVDSRQSETVVLVSEEAQASCERSLSRQGAKLIHRGTSGLLLIDRPISTLDLSACPGASSQNETFRLAKTPPATLPLDSKIDLPTLLRLIPAEEIGARSFVAANPKFDGRGITIAVLDTGIEVDHPMLTVTPDGSRKVLDFDDFSGEGRTSLEEIQVEAGKATASNGDKYEVGDLSADQFRLGIFNGASLAFSEDIAQNDTFTDIAVLAYSQAFEWLVRIDTNNNKDFTDEKELSNFSKRGDFTQIGEKRSLTVSVVVRADGRSVNLCFDDGAHGTHVAGIAAGFDPTGLQGVAPGATIITGKIGDNRLAGGSTTTASMLLAIDWAVQKGARIINLSYGIAAGSNIGKSLIDQYVNKIAREKDILFSISAGNEGPGLQTIGTPAGADLAITNGAYLSVQTARDNYGYLGFQENGLWYFSSVGPRLDGGMKPTLLAPGAALSSVPNFASGYANYRGTSMASPQTTGGLALLLSAAGQSELPVDRVSVTRAVYRSAVPVSGLTIAEQGHGLFSVPLAFNALALAKSDPIVEFGLSVTSPHSPEGIGKGIFQRSVSAPANPFTVTVTPTFGKPSGGIIPIRTYRLQPSAPWIQTPSNLWIGSSPKTFQVNLSPSVYETPGLYSERIIAIDESDQKMAFVVPVTVVVPEKLVTQLTGIFTVLPGTTKRLFLDVPIGATQISLEMKSSGPIVWGQLLNTEGKRIVELRPPDNTLPQPRIVQRGLLSQSGVYELDFTASPANRTAASVTFSLDLFGFSITPELSSESLRFDVLISSQIGAAILVPRLVQKKSSLTRQLRIEGSSIRTPFKLSESDLGRFSEIQFRTRVSKKVYDSMTDFPFRIFDPSGGLLQSGGLEVDSTITVDKLSEQAIGDYQLEIQGAFTFGLPVPWPLVLEESRLLKSPTLLFEYPRVALETGQVRLISIDITKLSSNGKDSLLDCATLQLDLVDGRTVHERDFCISKDVVGRFPKMGPRAGPVPKENFPG